MIADVLAVTPDEVVVPNAQCITVHGISQSLHSVQCARGISPLRHHVTKESGDNESGFGTGQRRIIEKRQSLGAEKAITTHTSEVHAVHQGIEVGVLKQVIIWRKALVTKVGAAMLLLDTRLAGKQEQGNTTPKHDDFPRPLSTLMTSGRFFPTHA
ncbi:MAG: hypothetical protein IPG10_02770 [Flavobacteriales bacterium]|nr:hypothetical protein [Flavobacteriales bacterium]MBK6753782.1 hypothetical protein [Flavobacteriales bacterium]MBK7086519.1 hypothetical protein [Flavobacteriales bacterium]MBK9073420.1 hypothetical protein [Flavobacteriales bacterium]